MRKHKHSKRRRTRRGKSRPASDMGFREKLVRFIQNLQPKAEGKDSCPFGPGFVTSRVDNRRGKATTNDRLVQSTRGRRLKCPQERRVSKICRNEAR